MNEDSLKEIYQKVYRKFPEVDGKKPVKHKQPNGQTLLIFKGEGKAPDGTKISRIVRVVINDSGKIIKMTTSR